MTKNQPSNPKDTAKQDPLSLDRVKSYIAKGPTFDNKYLRSSKAKYLAGLIIILTFATALFIRFKNAQENTQPIDQSATISQTVVRNDSHTKLARRAVAEYLKSHSDLSLSNGQKLFIETSLVQFRRGSRLTVGSSVEFSIIEIESLIEKSKNLTPLQIQKWSVLARFVKF